MAFDVGFDFRATAIFVTDPANCSPVLAETYPHTYGNGAVAGWSGTGPQNRDRNAALDARIAGINFLNNDGVQTFTFRVDLPAPGQYTITLAFGDASNAQTITAVLKDNTTALLTISALTTSGAANFVDATGTNRANWPSTQVPVTFTFASSTLNVVLGPFTGANSNCIAHLFVHQIASSGRRLALMGVGS